MIFPTKPCLLVETKKTMRNNKNSLSD